VRQLLHLVAATGRATPHLGHFNTAIGSPGIRPWIVQCVKIKTVLFDRVDPATTGRRMPDELKTGHALENKSLFVDCPTRCLVHEPQLSDFSLCFT
jgi:hypothetical protein